MSLLNRALPDCLGDVTDELHFSLPYTIRRSVWGRPDFGYCAHSVIQPRVLAVSDMP